MITELSILYHRLRVSFCSHYSRLTALPLARSSCASSFVLAQFFVFFPANFRPESETAHFTLIAEFPSITFTAAANSTYIAGSLLNISCNATGKPNPHVTWTHNGQVLSSGPKVAKLIFGTISKTDAGIYTCGANNSAGTTEKQLNLVVNCKYYSRVIQNGCSLELQKSLMVLSPVKGRGGGESLLQF